MMAMMAATIINSISVKPCAYFFIVFPSLYHFLKSSPEHRQVEVLITPQPAAPCFTTVTAYCSCCQDSRPLPHSPPPPPPGGCDSEVAVIELLVCVLPMIL